MCSGALQAAPWAWTPSAKSGILPNGRLNSTGMEKSVGEREPCDQNGTAGGLNLSRQKALGISECQAGAPLRACNLASPFQEWGTLSPQGDLVKVTQ